MARLLLVSYRLPVTVRVEPDGVAVTPSMGGVATGLKGPHEQGGGWWIGWPGSLSQLVPDRQSELDRDLAERRLLPLYVSDAEHRRFYDGFANGTLWPLFHYLLDKVVMDPRDFAAYRSVNERFANLVARQYRPGDLVWIHDYQLMMVPAFLRKRVPDARIGFFFHIPFPSSELFRTLPWRDELLKGVLGADVIGFHTLSYLGHFSSSILHVLGLEPTLDRLTYENRQIHLGAFPMGVDAPTIAAIAESPATRVAVEIFRRNAGDRKILLAVDRLDYTKGIPRRLAAFERLLERNPPLRERVRLVEIAVPSREGVAAYEDLRRRVDELVGRINGRFATATAVPIHHISRALATEDLVAMYRAADVMLVTPLRDGMNLVAKEFCAARTDEDGVLILSEFAGAAAELGEAVRVNPYDVEALARAMAQGLSMSRAERRRRMRILLQRVAEYDIHAWARMFLDALACPATAAPEVRQPLTAPAVLRTVIKEVREQCPLQILLDYDGTLVPFRPRPDLAAPDRGLVRLLQRLSSRPETHVHILSGRMREDLQRWFGDLPVGLYAEHGLWLRPPGEEWSLLFEPFLDWKSTVRTIMNDFVARTPGSFIEEKTASIAWHYRNAEPEFANHQANELRLNLTQMLANAPVEVLPGRKVVEVRVLGVNKGAAVGRILSRTPQASVLALGDDQTDEDMFAALPDGSCTICVGSRPTRARYALADWRAARNLLGQLL